MLLPLIAIFFSVVVKGRLLGTKWLICGSIPVYKSKKNNNNWELTNPSLVTLWKGIATATERRGKGGTSHPDHGSKKWRGKIPMRYAAAAAKSLLAYPTLCDPIDGSSPGSPVPGILQARTLEWVAISFSNAWKWKVKVKVLSHVRLLLTPWTAAYQAPPSMGFSRQEYWSGVPLPSLWNMLYMLKINPVPSLRRNC